MKSIMFLDMMLCSMVAVFWHFRASSVFRVEEYLSKEAADRGILFHMYTYVPPAVSSFKIANPTILCIFFITLTYCMFWPSPWILLP
jgi:hypothetical protein